MVPAGGHLSARKDAVRCGGICSALQRPLQRAAEAVAARCVGHCSMLHHLPHLNVFPHRASAGFIPEA